MTSKQDLEIKTEPGEPHCSIQFPGHYGSKCRNELTEKLPKPSLRKKTCTLDGFNEVLCTECIRPLGHIDFNAKLAHHINCHQLATLTHLKTLQESYSALQRSHDTLHESHNTLQESHNTLHESHNTLQESHKQLFHQLASKELQIASQSLEIEVLKVANASKNVVDQQDEDEELSPIIPLNDDMDLMLSSNMPQVFGNEVSNEEDGPTSSK